jgi:hypothetical protein
MGMGARGAGPGRPAAKPSDRGVRGLGAYNLAAVYRTLAEAEATEADLEATGVDARQIVVQDRSLTDEGPAKRVAGPVESAPPPTGEPVETATRRRDVDIARTVFSRTVAFTVGAAIGGAVLGSLVGALFLGWGLGTWIALAVGAVAGAVFGAMAGGIWGGMNQARTEDGVQVEVHTDDPDEARRVADVLGRRDPIRLDRMAVDKGLRSA